MYSKKYAQFTLQLDGDFFENKYTLNESFASDDIQVQGVYDWNGNMIWQCPYNKSISGFEIKLQFGISHIMLQFTPLLETTPGTLLTGEGFTYDCRHPGIFVDSYTDYILKNRDYDISMRKYQIEQQEGQAWASVAENVGFGAAFGGGAGAVAAGLGGVIEATYTSISNAIYEPQIRRARDKLQAKVTDQISLVGDSVTNLFYYDPFYKYTLLMDGATQTRMETDIETNGYYCDEYSNIIDTLFTNEPTTDSSYTVNPSFQADSLTIEGACNLVGKQQIAMRLMNGVEFI